MHPRPENLVAIGRAVVYYGRAAHAFSAIIKCLHCSICSLVRYDTNHYVAISAAPNARFFRKSGM